MDEAKVYKSGIGLSIIIPIIVIVGGLAVLYLVNGIWGGLIINLTVGGFIINLFMNTDYTITGDTLYVRGGFLVNIKIDVMTIRQIAETNNILSSPALSLDRLEIFYNQYDSVMISPKDKTAFIEHLKMINDKIEVKLKTKKA